MVSALVVPFLGIRLLLRWSTGRRIWQAVAFWLGGGFALLVYGTVAFVFAVCRGGEIGESGKRRLARAYGAPVVVALDRYHQEHGDYPRRLADLVPRYLADSELTAPQTSILGYPFEYRVDSSAYELLVRYVGPGMNECRYSPHRAWRCGGYF